LALRPHWSPSTIRPVPALRARDADERRKFCSDTCSLKLEVTTGKRHGAERKARAQAWRDGRRSMATEKPCETCGSIFKPLMQAGRPEPRFCSKSCAAIWSNAQRPNRFGSVDFLRRKAPPRPPRLCEQCGTRFTPNFEGKRFCTKACSSRANQRKRRPPYKNAL